MLKLSSITRNIDTKIVVSSVVAAIVLGGVVWIIRKLPSNSLTSPVKEVAEVVK